MSTKTIQIKDADFDTLKKYAVEVLGLPIKDKTPLPALRAKINTALNGATSFVIREGDDADEPAPLPEHAAAREAREIKSAFNQGKPDAQAMPDHGNASHVVLMIHLQDKPGGKEPVPIGVNGRAMLVPRGEDVKIPYAYYEVLSKAIETHYDPLPGGGLSEPRFVPRYPHNVLRFLFENQEQAAA